MYMSRYRYYSILIAESVRVCLCPVWVGHCTFWSWRTLCRHNVCFNVQYIAEMTTNALLDLTCKAGPISCPRLQWNNFKQLIA